jgi:hypothetical protein
MVKSLESIRAFGKNQRTESSSNSSPQVTKIFDHKSLDHAAQKSIMETDNKPSPPLVTPAPKRDLRRRQAVATLVTTDIDLIVEDGSGSTIAEATIQGIPTAPTAISLPIGTLTIPALATASDIFSLPVGDLQTAGQPTPSLSIQVPGASSQIVLSSPPPTPVPSEAPSSFSTSSQFPTFSVTNSTSKFDASYKNLQTN